MEAKLFARKRDEHLFEKNLEAIPKELHEVLKTVNPRQVMIDSEIIVQGVKNPLVAVFVGLSTRNLIESLRRKKKRNDLIVVIEPRLDVFKELIMTEDITDLLLATNVEFVLGITGTELLTNLFKLFTKTDPGHFISRVGKVHNLEKIVDPFVYNTPELQKEAMEIVKTVDDTVTHIILSTGCSDDQHRRWQLMIENRHNMFKSWNATSLKGKFDQTNAVCLGGGPSLDEFIEAYREYPSLKNCLILASDAVLLKLLKNDIRPHLVFRCERKKTSIFKGISKDMTKGVGYMAYPWTPPDYFNLFDETYFLFRNNGVCVFTDMRHIYVDGGVSSGNALVEFALELGVQNVFTAGLDLCIINGKTHTEDTQVEFDPMKSKDKWEKVLTYGGTMEDQPPVWKRCMNEYGQSIDKHRNHKNKKFGFYGTSPRSVKILGSEYKSWEECAALCTLEIDVRARIEKYREAISKEAIAKFYSLCKEANDNLKDIKESCEITLGLEKDAEQTCDQEVEKLMRRIRTECKDNWDLIRAVRQLDPNLEKLTKNIADVFDLNFKSKWMNNKFYRMCLLDVLQHDTLIYENKVNSLANTFEKNDDKFLSYADFTRDFLDKVDYYCDRFIELFDEVDKDAR